MAGAQGGVVSDIESHIATIGRALWARDGRGGGAGRATVMIGAGFSLNATPQAAGAHSFPMWKGLAKSLIDAIQPGCEYCNCLREDGTASGQARPTGCTRYERRLDLMERAAGTSGMMELGEKFEARKGAALLQGVLQRSVPDLEYGPGKPHQDLVCLPWADIFTTNWDTLLEQAVDAYDRSYELVVQPKQLATATAPRIVKLHGCVRSGTKKIFTEEDFRTYPAQYAPFRLAGAAEPDGERLRPHRLLGLRSKLQGVAWLGAGQSTRAPPTCLSGYQQSTGFPRRKPVCETADQRSRSFATRCRR